MCWALVKPTRGQLPFQRHTQGYATTFFLLSIFNPARRQGHLLILEMKKPKALREQATCSGDMGGFVVGLELHISLQVTK